MNKEYAPIIIRLGMSIVFILFGLINIFNPTYLLGYLPQFTLSLLIQPTTILLINGIFDQECFMIAQNLTKKL